MSSSLDASTWSVLQRRVRGELLSDPASCLAFAGKQLAAAAPLVMPQAVLRCVDVADVQHALAWLQQTRMPFAVRSGGHCFADYSQSDGLVIDLSAMSGCRLHGDSAELGPGALAGDVALTLAEAGRSLPTGGCPLVAMGGLSLVGGFGLQGRVHGLVCDAVEQIELVDASGSVHRLSAESDHELFWALCGAGSAGFGVVTSLRLRTHALPCLRVLFGEWPLAQAADLIESWAAYAPVADSALNIELALQADDDIDTPANVELFGAIIGCESAVAGFDAIEAALRGALPAACADLSSFDLQGEAAARYLVGLIGRRGEPGWLPSRPYLEHGYQSTRSAFHGRSPSRSAIESLVDQFGADRRPLQYRELELIPWGGAYARRNPHSCFAHRQAHLMIRHTAVVGARSRPEDRSAAAAWADASRACLSDTASGGVYAGYAERGLAGFAQAYYGGAVAQLDALKRRIDPNGLFSHPQTLGQGAG